MSVQGLHRLAGLVKRLALPRSGVTLTPMGTNVQQDADSALANIATIAVATFVVVTLTGTLRNRLATSIAANIGTNKQIKDESGVLMCVTAATGLPAVWYTEPGLQRLELERAASPGY